MPYCKYCHERISRLDKDLCPFCGNVKPLEGVESKTTDITQTIDPIEASDITYKHKSKKVLFLYSLLGPFGGTFFYLGYPKTSIFMICLTLFFVGGSGLFMGLLNILSWPLAFLIPFLVIELIHIIIGILLIRKHNLRDKKGRFIR